MTESIDELRSRGVSEIIIAWRRWRREMHLTQMEAAAVLGLHPRTLIHAEMGDPVSPATVARLETLMERWDESKRPARRPDRRGGRRVRGVRGAQGKGIST